MDKWVMAILLRETEGYKTRLAKLNGALEAYINTIPADEIPPKLEELMLASYDLAKHIRANFNPPKWESRVFNLHVANAVRDLMEVITSKEPYGLTYEVMRLEALSRTIYEYMGRSRKSRRTL